jgi:ribosomal protein S18 acetylase RimI-like enzyme
LKLRWIYGDKNINWGELQNLYKIAPLGDKNMDDLKTTFTNSMFKCFAYFDDKIVGAGRALADGVDTSYICDVVVHPDFQGQYIGKEIMRKLMEFSKKHNKIILYSNIGKEEFYKKLGFAKMNTAMAVFKNQEQAKQKGFIK